MFFSCNSYAELQKDKTKTAFREYENAVYRRCKRRFDVVEMAFSAPENGVFRDRRGRASLEWPGSLLSVRRAGGWCGR